MSGRDPDKVGWGSLAYYALEADEPRGAFHRAALGLQERLGVLSARLAEARDQEGSAVAADAQLFAIVIAELLDEEGASDITARIGYRRRGPPAAQSRMEMARKAHRAAAVSFRLQREGLSAKAAIADARKLDGLSEATIKRFRKVQRDLRKKLGKTENGGA